MLYSKLQYISCGVTSAEQIDNIKRALDAGCNWIQLRFKNATEKELMITSEQTKIICSMYNAIFIVNDNVDIAKNVNADGVHLGLQDTSVTVARTILGQKKIIGGTANTLTNILSRVEEKCNYIGLGPYKFTTTKKKLNPILCIEGYKKIMSELKNKNILIPIYAVGGIVLKDVEQIMKTGIYGIAVSGIITNYVNKKKLVKQLNNTLYANI